MGALLILVLVAVYFLTAYKVTIKIRPWLGKIAAITLFLLVPTADAVYGRIMFDRMCDTEAGLKILRTVNGVEGFYNSQMPPSDRWITQHGYRFIEGADLGGKDARMSLRPDGTILLEKGISPISKYIYEVRKGDIGDIYLRTERIILIKDTNEVLGKQVTISYAGGWFNRFVASLYASRGHAGVCGPNTFTDDLVTNTLKPIQ
jgi:hypothetical protein